MVTTGNRGRLEGLAEDLEEDIATRWVPDVLGSFDLSECLKTSSLTAKDVQFVDVPKSLGRSRVAPVLSAQAMRALRDAVAGLRSVSDALLESTVCGYRVGSVSGSAYSDEYMRFRHISNGLAESHRYVVIADVRRFFESVSRDTVSARMSALLGDVWQPIDELLVKANEAGIVGLPAGYGDARLIANHLLRPSDAAIECSFTRWVDDYRIYADTAAEAERAVHRLAASLSELGLSLNYDKLETYKADDYLARRHGAPLESVYHPNSEPIEAVLANLRAVFLNAVNDDNRRLLRFALPRLAEQRDAIAVDFAINQIAQDSIDTPRLVYYLSTFLDREDVQDRVEDLLQTSKLSAWTTMRLTPLLCNIPLQDGSFDFLSETIKSTVEPALWASLLRVMAVHGQKDFVVDEVTHREPLDPRAAVGAFVDICCTIPDDLRSLAPLTAKAADNADVVPRPTAYTLL